MLNFMNAGITCVYAFDTTDIWVCASRLSSELRYKHGVKVYSMLMLITWWYIRVFAFPIMYYLNFRYYSYNSIPNWEKRPEEMFVIDC